MMGSTKKSAREVQQELAQLFGARNIIPWDLYTSEQHEFLVKKIDFLIPDAEGKDKKTVRDNGKLKTFREKLVEAAWNQRKYGGGQLYMSILYVVWTKSSKELGEALKEKEYSVHPVLRVRKCRTLKGKTEDCCMIFIDEGARVYKNWQGYIEQNNLPDGVIVAPKRGCYAFDDNDRVVLECQYTPASSFFTQAHGVVNTVAGVAGVVASGVMIAGAAIPAVVPALGVAAVVGIGSGIIGAASSIGRLINRGKHEECIDLSDSQARADWIGVVGGAVSLGASAASSALARVAATGRSVSIIANGTVNGLNIAAIMVNGVGVGNNVIEMIIKLLNDEEITSMDVVQLGASLFLVTHSVYNFRTASQIVDSSRSSKIASMRKALSNRQRKAFDRTYKETLRLKGPSDGKMDVIRSLKNMPDSKQPLNDLFKVNKQMRQNGMRAAFHPDGNIIINNDRVLTSHELRQNLQHGIGENIAQNVAPIPSSVPGETPAFLRAPPQTGPNVAGFRFTSEVVLNVAGIVGSTVLAAIQDVESFDECVNNILSHVTKEALKKLLQMAAKFYSEFVSQIQELLGRFISLEEILFRIFEIILKECGIGDVEKYIEQLTSIRISSLFGQLRLLYDQQAPQTRLEAKCTECDGYHVVC